MSNEPPQSRAGAASEPGPGVAIEEASAAPGAPVARLAASQLGRMRRIVDAAVAQAEEGGFEGVRLRDVAENSGVALGTLYKYFRSKEDILLFALSEEVERLEAVIATHPAKGGTAIERLTDLFARATEVLTRRSNFARALLRSIASGDQQTAIKVAGFHLRMTRLIVVALRGESLDPSRPASEMLGSDWERRVAFLLQHVWFASLVGWSGGLHPSEMVVERMRDTLELLLEA
ncbi:MAG: TetR/AcrR family transcriptional regulator [Myxococcota bacterium]|nr:TetR/AcrR family transcriptional regulator [Myxococcota bacterium]